MPPLLQQQPSLGVKVEQKVSTFISAFSFSTAIRSALQLFPGVWKTQLVASQLTPGSKSLPLEPELLFISFSLRHVLCRQKSAAVSICA